MWPYDLVVSAKGISEHIYKFSIFTAGSGVIKLFLLSWISLVLQWGFSLKYYTYFYSYPYFTLEPTFHFWQRDCIVEKLFLKIVLINRSFNKYLINSRPVLTIQRLRNNQTFHHLECVPSFFPRSTFFILGSIQRKKKGAGGISKSWVDKICIIK